MYHERRRSTSFKYTTGNEMELDSHVDPNDLSTGVNPCLLGKRIASYKFCFRRTCISITMKFKNEVVNGEGTITPFVVTDLVCVLLIYIY